MVFYNLFCIQSLNFVFRQWKFCCKGNLFSFFFLESSSFILQNPLSSPILWNILPLVCDLLVYFFKDGSKLKSSNPIWSVPLRFYPFFFLNGKLNFQSLDLKTFNLKPLKFCLREGYFLQPSLASPRVSDYLIIIHKSWYHSQLPEPGYKGKKEEEREGG